MEPKKEKKSTNGKVEKETLNKAEHQAPLEEQTQEQSNGKEAQEAMKEEKKEEKKIQQEQEQKTEEQPQEQQKSEAEVWKERYVRLLAEFDNYRKRVAREQAQAIERAKEETWKALFPIIDDILRATEAAEKAKDLKSVVEGLQMLKQKIFAQLEKANIQPIEAKGKPFDASLHEAVASIEVDDPEKKGKVIEEVEKGYIRNGKVIKYAKVITGK